MAKRKEEGLTRLEGIIAAAGKNVLTPEEVCLLYGMTAEQLANAVQKIEIMVRRGRNGQNYFKRADIEAYLSLGQEVVMEEYPLIASMIRTASEKK